MSGGTAERTSRGGERNTGDGEGIERKRTGSVSSSISSSSSLFSSFSSSAGSERVLWHVSKCQEEEKEKEKEEKKRQQQQEQRKSTSPPLFSSSPRTRRTRGRKQTLGSTGMFTPSLVRFVHIS